MLLTRLCQNQYYSANLSLKYGYLANKPYTKHSKIPVQYVFIISWIYNMLNIQFTIIVTLDFCSHLIDIVLTFTYAIQKGYSSFASSVFEKTRDRMIPSQEFEYFLMTTCAIKAIYVVPF